MFRIGVRISMVLGMFRQLYKMGTIILKIVYFNLYQWVLDN